MAETYTIRQGDDITTIAKRFSFNDWRTIYFDASNAAFRAQRPDPFVLYPGESINIPDKQPRVEEAATGSRHRFYIHGMTRVLRVRLRSPFGEPLAHEPYEIHIGGALLEKATTDGDGLFSVEVPVDAREGKISTREHSWDIGIGDLNPMDHAKDLGVSGAQGRLLNLGYPVGAVDGKLGPKTRASLRMFQNHAKLAKATGDLDEDTKQALVKAYGM